jgi:hypothetical protein
MTTSDKLREIAHKYGGAIITGYGQSSASGSTEMFTAEEQCLSDLTALISENYYPKEFTEWVGQNNAILCYVNIRKIWVSTRFVLGENPHEEYDEYTTEELFEYWKTNEQ